MKGDADPEKWVLKEHTSIKHEILEKYLTPWFNKLSEITDNLLYVDGFAGRGRYEDGEPGSPLIAIDVFEDRLGSLGSKVERVICQFVEAHPENFGNLETEVEKRMKTCEEDIQIDIDNTTFQSYSTEFFEYLDDENLVPLPSFIFVDPFGYSGLPFDIISNYISYRSSGLELFITCMTSEMARWMTDPGHQKAITEMLGTDEWQERITEDMGQAERAEEFARIYQQQLREEAGAEYVWLFEMSKSEERRNAYYLFHVTNHFDGFRIMKSIMYHAGDGANFRYLGPDHYPYKKEQLALGEFGVEDRDSLLTNHLTKYLLDEMNGERLTFYELLEQTYHETDAIDKHYRKACKTLSTADQATIHNHPERPKGTENGLNDDDEVEFHGVGLDAF